MQSYQIIVRGKAGPMISAAFGEMELSELPEGRLMIRGEFVDQASLHSTLHRLQDLRLEILTIRSA